MFAYVMAAKPHCFVAMAFGQKDTDAIFKILRKTLAPLVDRGQEAAGGAIEVEEIPQSEEARR